jgi:ABC-type transport system involved in cytochrome bd biosynthesis fused ATPase/permease subunit
MHMKRKNLWLTLLLVSLAALVLLGAPFLFTRGNREYSSNLSQLRAKFNQDKGKVRLLLLLSPT